jgi:hypothetical protein
VTLALVVLCHHQSLLVHIRVLLPALVELPDQLLISEPIEGVAASVGQPVDFGAGAL